MIRNLLFLLLSGVFPILLFSQKSFTLQEAIEFGIVQSHDIKLKSLATDDANAQIKEIRAFGMPKLNAGINYQHFLAVPSQPVQDFLGPTVYGILFRENVIPERDLGEPQTFKFTLFQPNTLSGNIELTSLLFDGSYLYGLKAARFYKELVAQEKNVSVQKLKEQITKAYLSILIARENEKVLSKNMDNLAVSLNDIKVMYQNGFVEMLDVDRLQVSYDNLETERNNIRQLVNISKNLLKFQMNYPLEQDIELTQTLDQLLVEWSNTADDKNAQINYNEREEYKLLSLSQELNKLDFKRVQAGYYPSLRAFTSAQASLFRRNLFDNDETGWIPQSAVGLAMSIPIYDGGEKSAKLQRIRINMQKADLEKQNFEKAMTMQISNATIAFENAKYRMESRKKALDLNQRIYDLTLVKFKEGVGSSLEVTQSEGALFRTQGDYTNALYDMLSALIDLQSAKGTL